MMDIPANILPSLMCSKCEQLLKRGPVYQQHDGAPVCGLCQASKEAQPASRCLLYESTAQLLRFPCRYQEEGCPITVPFVAAGSVEFNHEDTCEFRQYVCPVLGSNRCDWAGRRDQLQQHCQEEHPDRVLPNPAQITPDIRRSQMTDYVISAFHFLFLVHTRVCVTTAKLHYAVRLFGDPQLTSNYYFTVTVRRGENLSCWSRDVLPQGLLVLQEHTALNLSTNGLLSVLGGWDGASLSVEVKAHGPQTKPEKEQGAQGSLVVPEKVQESQLRQAEQEHEHCRRCKARTPRLYRNRRGWLCLSCAPRETCIIRGCIFQDIGQNKRNKHSTWFCQQRTWCYLCGTFVQRSKLWPQHYKTCKMFRVIPAGTKFLIQRDSCWQLFLVDTAVGHMICGCENTQHNFSLRVLAPVAFEQLQMYRCEVLLECAGNTRTHTPDTKYDTPRDWEIECKNDNFFTNPEVYVYLQVNKIK